MARSLIPCCRRALVAVMGALFLQSAAGAAPTAVEAVGPLPLTTGDDYPPFTAVDLPQGGLATDIVRQAFRKAGLETKVEWLPWARGLYEVQKGTYAATFPYIHTRERDAEFLFSDPLLDLEETFFVRKGLLIDPKQTETLRGRIFCLPVGWATTGRLDALLNLKLLTVVRPPGIGQCVKMTLAGHADLFDSDLRQGMASLAAAGVKGGQIQPLLPIMQVNSTHLIVSRNRPGAAELIERFNQGLKALRADGSYGRIVQSHADSPAQAVAPVDP